MSMVIAAHLGMLSQLVLELNYKLSFDIVADRMIGYILV